MTNLNRRDFLYGAMAAGAGLAATQLANAAEARPKIEPVDPHAPKYGRLLKENETIGLGIIGVGMMGGEHFEDLCDREKSGQNQRICAIADVYTHRLDYRKKWLKKLVGRDIDGYLDYHKLLDRDDIHGVIIATPDHWHAQITLDALAAGKDVYCQKPMSYTIEESLAMRDAVLASGRIFQCGAQRSSDDFWWIARDFIKKGGIGKVLWAQADYSRNSSGGPDDRGGIWNRKPDEQASADPATGEWYIDWERWLGNAPKRPFSPERFFGFRRFWDYSGGLATDLLYHVMAPLIIALDAKAPERAVGSGGIYVQHDDREVPDTFTMTLDYPDDYTVQLTSGAANRQMNETMIRGHKATIRPFAVNLTADIDEEDIRHGMEVTPEKEFKEWFQKEFGVEKLVVQPRPRPGHLDKWLEAMRSRGDVHLDAETALRAMVGIRLATDSYRQDKVAFYDPEKECQVDAHPRPNRPAKVPESRT